MFFTVVTTVYNSENYINKAMNSVKQQSFSDYEYLIIDNGSTDSSNELIRTFINENSHLSIRLICLEKNKGISGGRNTGIEQAKGDYICFLDADDYWEPEKLQSVKENIDKHKKYNVFCHWEKHIKGDRKKVMEYRKIDYDNPFYDLISNGNCLSTSAMAVKRELLQDIGGFDINLIAGEEDYDCWLRLARIGAKFYMIEKPLGCWLIRTDSVSSRHVVHTEAVIKMLTPHFAYLSKSIGASKSKKIQNRISAMNYCGCGRTLSVAGDRKNGNQMYIRSIKVYPKYFKAYAGLILNFFRR